tara:strand:+ start:1282 stop:1842 length:561 start_codon:yes stop_codon:yes gene_type:complete
MMAGKGIEPGSLGAVEAIADPSMLAAGAVAAARSAQPDATSSVVDGSAGPALIAELAANGLEVVEVDDPLTAEADLLFVGAKVGMVDHVVADRLRCRAIVPTGPLPITTKAVAHCQRNGVLALPDFITSIGPLVAGKRDEVCSLISETISSVMRHEDGPIIGACERAEAFLTEWQDDLPFGRPMAA